MSSNFFRGGQAGPRAESVDSRVDFFFDDQIPVVYESRHRPRFSGDNRDRFFSEAQQSLDQRVFRDRSPLSRPRLYEPPARLDRYYDQSDYPDYPCHRQEVYRGPYSEQFDHDPRSYPTHSDFGQEDFYNGDERNEYEVEEEFIRTQLKVMDIGSPLIDLYTRLCEKTADSPVEIQFRHSLQAALKQWGRAFAHISKKQREAVIGSTDPRVDYLLKEDIGLTSNKEARELLFTGEFLERMLKEAHQDSILAKRDQAAANLTCGKRNPFQSTRRGSSMDALLRQDQHVDRQQAERGRPRSRRSVGNSRGGRVRGYANKRSNIHFSMETYGERADVSKLYTYDFGAKLLFTNISKNSW
ncbi:hypothetical protein OUZ56_012946 [Daphnia magna]|uniref:Uncharacterized protein n=1 Tax=Daphnia magna TaxID=35525 RepID=A0ABQ9Z599_9CRUS|nr:hypothetical protein OUZ56_012946 [Daphnia magna]